MTFDPVTKWIERGREAEQQGCIEHAIHKYETALKCLKPCEEDRAQLIRDKIRLLRSQPSPNRTTETNTATESPTVASSAKPNVLWDDVAGLKAVKTKVRMLIEFPLRQPHLSQSRTGVSILLYGPPGTGKTLLSQAIATASSGEYFHITSGDILSKYMGENEKALRDVFSRAGSGKNSVLFVDEIDSIASSRVSDENQSVRSLKTELMVQIDGLLQNPSVIFVSGTNCPWDIDPSVLRRFSSKVLIPLPDKEDRYYLIRRELGRFDNDVQESDISVLAESTHRYSGSDLSQLIKVARELAREEMANATRFTIDPSTGKYSICADANHPAAVTTSWDQVPESMLEDNKVTVCHLRRAMQFQKPTTTDEQLARYNNWTEEYGGSGK
jgi:vacuolar protein-sorting-associated protein 4